MCGLAGAIGPKINEDKLKILLLYNDSRGGDSCGIYDKIGVSTDFSSNRDNKGTFAQYLSKICLELKGNFLMGHARAASPGIPVTKENAHPFAFENIVGAHNGVIRNIKELADTYGVPKLSSDSKTLFSIIDTLSTDAEIAKLLGEYIGAAALTWMDKQNNLYLFRGESTKYEGGTILFEERPLYIGILNNTIYYSSIEESLITAGIHCYYDETYQIPGNTVLVFNKGKLVRSFEVDRSKAYMEVFNSLPKHSARSSKNTTKDTTSIINSETSSEDLMLSDIVTPSNGKVYMSAGLYYRNGHLLGKNTIAEFYLTSSGEVVYGKATPIKGNYYKVKLANGQEVTARYSHFYHGHLFKNPEIVPEFKVKYVSSNGNDLLFLDAKVSDYFVNPIRLDLPQRLNFKSWGYPNLNKWIFNSNPDSRVGKMNAYFPFNSKGYRFVDGVCVEVIEDLAEKEMNFSVDSAMPEQSMLPVTTLEESAAKDKLDEAKYSSELIDLGSKISDFLSGWSHLRDSKEGYIAETYAELESCYAQLETIIMNSSILE